MALLFGPLALQEARAESAGRFNRNLAQLLAGRNRGINSAFFDRQQQIGAASLRVVGGRTFVLNVRTGNFTPLIFSNRFPGVPFGIPAEQFEQTQREIQAVALSRLQEKELIPGQNNNNVLQFLINRGLGPAITGQLRVDMASAVLPETAYTKGLSGNAAMGVKTAALNFLLNTISQSKSLLSVGARNVVNGQVGLNLRGFVGGGGLAALVNPADNPYACAGNGRDPVRLDWMIARSMDPDIYYQLIGAPKTELELSRQLGYQFNRARTGGNKITALLTESAVGSDKALNKGTRTLEVQNAFGNLGGSVYRSFDNRNNNPSGALTDAGDPFLNGINASFEAGELIFHKPNGFLGFWLSAYKNNDVGNRQNAAPVEIARNDGYCGLKGADVSSPLACLCCHKKGFLGGGTSLVTNKAYTENFGKIPSFHRQFFTTNPVYAARAKRDSQIFQNALIRSGSFIREAPGSNDPAPLLVDFYNAYKKDLGMNDIARELGGASPQQVAALLRTDMNGKVGRAKLEEKVNIGGRQISRFCQLKLALGGAAQAPGRGITGGFQQQLGFVNGQSQHLGGGFGGFSGSRPPAQ